MIVLLNRSPSALLFPKHHEKVWPLWIWCSVRYCGKTLSLIMQKFCTSMISIIIIFFDTIIQLSYNNKWVLFVGSCCCSNLTLQNKHCEHKMLNTKREHCYYILRINNLFDSFTSVLMLLCFRRVNLVNAYSMYGPQFVEPVYKKDKQESMYESGEIENILHVPVKAARVDATCSVFHDELVRYVNINCFN